MVIRAAIIAFCILWLLLCLRFYAVISRENVGQRRMIAIAGGLGAGLIYVLGSMLAPLLAPLFAPRQDAAPVEASQEVRIRTK